MGCFSYLCKECGKGIMSNSFRGEQVKLFYLKDGKVIEQMEGEYDSYGTVFIDGTQVKDVEHPLRESKNWENQTSIDDACEAWEWARYRARRQNDEELRSFFVDNPDPKVRALWTEDSDAPFNNDWGIAAVHVRCFKEDPTTISESDPNQGWGENGELFGNIANELDVEAYGGGI